MQWQKHVAAALGLLVIWSGLAAWQYLEYRRDRDLILEAIHQQSHSVMSAVVGGIRSHRRFGPFFRAQLLKMLDELVKTEDIRAVALVAIDRQRGTIVGVKVLSGAPCGSTFHVARLLTGIAIKEAIPRAGLIRHHFPCLASMQKEEIDEGEFDTLMHISGYVVNEEVERQIAGA